MWFLISSLFFFFCVCAAKLGVVLTQLTPEQAAYISVPADGPYKPDTYRY
jgi:hypothetical protein